MNIPLVKVIMPSCPADAKGLLKAAVRDDNPVVFFNHTSIGGMKGEVPDGEYITPLGKGDIKREGTDITLCTVGAMVNTCLKAAKELESSGVSAEVIDLRTLKPWDKEMVIGSVKKTGRFLAVDESYHTCGAGAEWAATVAEEAFGFLKAPVSRLSGTEVPIPFSPELQKLVVPTVEGIAAKAVSLVNRG
jgi:pyruvate dehydrogenase E1 component beta subunit